MTQETLHVAVTHDEPTFDEAHRFTGDPENIEQLVDNAMSYFTADDPLGPDGDRRYGVWDADGVLLSTGIVSARLSYVVSEGWRKGEE